MISIILRWMNFIGDVALILMGKVLKASFEFLRLDLNIQLDCISSFALTHLRWTWHQPCEANVLAFGCVCECVCVYVYRVLSSRTLQSSSKQLSSIRPHAFCFSHNWVIIFPWWFGEGIPPRWTVAHPANGPNKLSDPHQSLRLQQ